MQVDVINGLARACIHIEHGAITLLMDVGLLRQRFRNLEHMADQRVVLRLHIIQRRDVFSWND